MKKGAVDFIEKPFNDQEMLDRIQVAIERDAKIRREQTLREQLAERLTALTPREKLVMSLVVDGLSNKEIARDLGISPRTIEVHRAKVMTPMLPGAATGTCMKTVHTSNRRLRRSALTIRTRIHSAFIWPMTTAVSTFSHAMCNAHAAGILPISPIWMTRSVT